ncbi:XtrA/YqaO family protein [Lysinibacillus sp. NPDC093190]|uniref:XtrA/YqaO family protein n=1 Tax=Lysinibacillus sp. NPDC093190 TaxID=3390575 RepID=UPI003CFF60B4
MESLKIDANGALYIPNEKLKSPCVIVFSDGKAKIKSLQQFGTMEIITQDNKVSRINCKESILF